MNRLSRPPPRGLAGSKHEVHRGVQNATEISLVESNQLLEALRENTAHNAMAIVEELGDLVDFSAAQAGGEASLDFGTVLDVIRQELLRNKVRVQKLQVKMEALEEECDELDAENEELHHALVESTEQPRITTRIGNKKQSTLVDVLLQGDELYQRFMETSQLVRLGLGRKEEDAQRRRIL